MGVAELSDWQVVSDSSGDTLGEVTKVWSGCLKECCTAADNFHVRCQSVWLRIRLSIDIIYDVNQEKIEHIRAPSPVR